jgi:hypothetical protein
MVGLEILKFLENLSDEKVVVLILVDKTRNLFDKFQTGCVWEVCVAIL